MCNKKCNGNFVQDRGAEGRMNEDKSEEGCVCKVKINLRNRNRAPQIQWSDGETFDRQRHQ